LSFSILSLPIPPEAGGCTTVLSAVEE
jgi:hypothetical protein